VVLGRRGIARRPRGAPKMERPQLVAGPYRRPPLRRGDRTTCLYRQCEVAITGRSKGRISWPRCQALNGRGESGLLVDAELARAVRTESAVAIGFWWGVNASIVALWRRAFGVGRSNSEGSRRLIAAANTARAASRKLSPAEVERRCKTAIDLNLRQFLKMGFHGPRWSPEQIALLGRLADAEIAARTGRTPHAVRTMRHRLGIPSPGDRRRRAFR
jgi:hypothetical protein